MSTSSITLGKRRAFGPVASSSGLAADLVS
ncbi:unannotated protein [freshwater metagenome]|uniref:Unannotated protein n=1 Tax=freshwater metagenome TaxID=449393 RepID=A0A6J7D5Q8_9ZZZZ